MLALLSNLNLVTRVELTVSKAEREKCLTGSVLTWAGAVPGANVSAVAMVWSEANRSHEKAWEAASPAAVTSALGSPRFSPDVEDSGQVTVLYGKFRGLTNMLSNASAATVGQGLTTDNTTKLLKAYDVAATDTWHPWGYVTKADFEYSHLGDNYTVIEFVTV